MKLSNISKDLTIIEGEWMSDHNGYDSNISEDVSEIPEIGDAIRTKKSQMEGKVEKIEESGDSLSVLFRTQDGRLMRSNVQNVTVIEKLADDRMSQREGLKFSPGSFPDVDHMVGNVYKSGDDPKLAPSKKQFSNLNSWNTAAQEVNSMVHDDSADIITTSTYKKYVGPDGKTYAMWSVFSGNGFVVSSTNEGMALGGINRVAPAQDVSYEKVLDEVRAKWLSEQGLDELSVGKMQAFQKAVKSPERMKNASLSQLNRDVEGNRRANRKISTKTGDRTGRQLGEDNTDSKVEQLKKWAIDNYEDGGDTFVETYSDEDFALMLDDNHGNVAKTIEFMQILCSVWKDRRDDSNHYNRGEVDEAFKDDFSDILGKQHKEVVAAKKMPVKNIPYHGWTIRYRPAASESEKVQWQVMRPGKKGENDIVVHKGEAMSDEDAVSQAEDFIKKGGGTKQEATDKVTIDFNVNFTKEFGDEFFANIIADKGSPALLVAYSPENTLKRTHIRNQKDKMTATTTKLTSMAMSPKESNQAGLQPNGRYILGGKVDAGNGISKFPLVYQSTVQGKGDMVKLGKPGLTVAHNRDVTEDSDPCWKDYKQLGMKTKGGKQVPNCVPKANEEYRGPWQGDAEKLKKAPKSEFRGKGSVTLSNLVQDTIRVHGVKWAFNEYVKKHGMPPRHFKIYAGL